MEEYPRENFECQIRYEIVRDIKFHDTPILCRKCGAETISTYGGECMQCTRKLQWMAEDCWKSAQKAYDLKYNGDAMAKGKDKQKKQPKKQKGQNTKGASGSSTPAPETGGNKQQQKKR